MLIMPKAISFTKEMTGKLFPIETGKLISILNEVDAKEFGLFPGDRLEITNSRNGKKCITFLDVSKDALLNDEVGLFQEVADRLGHKPKDVLMVRAVEPIESVEFVKKKMRNEKLSQDEIKQIVKDIADDKFSDLEATAFMSAVYMRGLDLDETIYMTKALIENGNKIEFKKGIVVDKHSVGGCNGRATMITVPIVAAANAGLIVPKTSSRSITSAAGTADSMEVLAPVSFSIKEVQEMTEKVGAVIVWGGAVDLAPADDKIIKIEHPLSLDPEGQVIASVLAKKSSVGSKFVVIDLPVGKFVKIKDKETALRMAKKFVEVGKQIGMDVDAVITDGEEPSGLAFGPALEAKFALEILEGKRFDNLAQKSCELAGIIFEMTGTTKEGKGYDLAVDILTSGKALLKMKEIIKIQGGKIDSSLKVPLSEMVFQINSDSTGVIDDIDTRKITKIARLAGAPADKKAGVLLLKRKGEKVSVGENLFTIYAENQQKLESAQEYAIKEKPYSFKRVILETIR
jgi:AMP phosphorylase